jgi:hypothetical protein
MQIVGDAALREQLAHHARAREDDGAVDERGVEKFEDVEERSAGAAVSRRVVQEERADGHGGRKSYQLRRR